MRSTRAKPSTLFGLALKDDLETRTGNGREEYCQRSDVGIGDPAGQNQYMDARATEKRINHKNKREHVPVLFNNYDGNLQTDKAMVAVRRSKLYEAEMETLPS